MPKYYDDAERFGFMVATGATSCKKCLAVIIAKQPRLFDNVAKSKGEVAGPFCGPCVNLLIDSPAQTPPADLSAIWQAIKGIQEQLARLNALVDYLAFEPEPTIEQPQALEPPKPEFTLEERLKMRAWDRQNGIPITPSAEIDALEAKLSQDSDTAF